MQTDHRSFSGIEDFRACGWAGGVGSRRRWVALAVTALAAGWLSLSGHAAEQAAKKPEPGGAKEARPMLAIWRDSDGRRPGAPYLRIAIYNDGRVVFAKDPKKWGHELQEGKIEPEKIAELKKALEATGVFELKGTTYLVPDAPVDCIMLDLGAKKQMLRWDEVETPGYGINIDPKPQHVKFMSTWKDVKALALAATPKESKEYAGKFTATPRSWPLKPAIQSE